MAPWGQEIMRVRESKVITIKTLGLNQKPITHSKRWETNGNTDGKTELPHGFNEPSDHPYMEATSLEKYCLKN